MKDLLNERLIFLATAKENMMYVSDMMDQWDNSQLHTEKNAFEIINMSDEVFNLSKEGSLILSLIQECCYENSVTPSAENYLKLKTLLTEISLAFQNIIVASSAINDVAHKLEEEVAFQKEFEEGIKNHLTLINENIETSVACAEMHCIDL